MGDVSNFYGSIYTHSLEWALHAKAVAKANVGKRSKPPLLGTLLDQGVGNGQLGQTKGIPIGPRTSLLLAELIMCAIDEQLQSALPTTRTYCTRMIDDLEFAAESRAEAEGALHLWESAVTGFELDINTTKTKISEGPLLPDTVWRTALQQYQFRSLGDLALANDIRGFLSLAFEQAASAAPGAAVLTYAVRVIAELARGPLSWAATVYALMAVATAEPSSLKQVYAALLWGRSQGLRLDRDLITTALNGICEYHAKLEHGSEIAWSLQILRDLGYFISNENAVLVEGMEDNASLLLLMDMAQLGYVEGGSSSFTHALERAKDVNALIGADWLLAYECERLGWSSTTNFASEPYWKELLDLDVAFFRSGSGVAGSMIVPSVASARPTSSQLITSGWAALLDLAATATPPAGHLPVDDEGTGSSDLLDSGNGEDQSENDQPESGEYG